MEVKIGEGLDELYCNGKRACQHKNIILCLDKMFAEIGPVSRIIEIGTDNGGFTEMLRSHDISKKCRLVYTWNMMETEGLSESIVQIVGDCFMA